MLCPQLKGIWWQLHPLTIPFSKKYKNIVERSGYFVYMESYQRHIYSTIVTNDGGQE
jgi:hypothetical protein